MLPLGTARIAGSERALEHGGGLGEDESENGDGVDGIPDESFPDCQESDEADEGPETREKNEGRKKG